MSRTFQFLLPALFAVLLLGGCAFLRELHLPAQLPAAPEIADEAVNAEGNLIDAEFEHSVDTSEAESLLTFLAYLETLSPDEQDQVYQEVKNQFDDSPDQQVRLRLALLQIQPGRSFTDFSEGRKLLQDYGRDSQEQGDAGLGALANLLEALAREHNLLTAQLVDEKRANEHLARQLNELKNIENILKSREVESLPGM
ncbi:hypothetical protein [Geoalkalibacter subterraneus]|uniref:Uncharacterized protein n=1 Tax=Geoalkalibacter subterraneus TaxID=483547 RepID=A0A0B5FP82_9BACT|nr:hypothetical protein [Geoalkalibacter subterraneus]AJF05905.1 hypothetical protein GSUB_04085 [Geoalkalibacter subterraneus]